MLSAFHEMGGNVLQRFLDSHPQCMAYHFESTIATSPSSNMIAGPNHWLAQRYAYPEFGTEWSPEECYHAMVDHELKPYLRSRHVSKFKGCGLEIDEKKRLKRFKYHVEELTYKRANDYGSGVPVKRREYIEAFFRATFDSWENFARTGKEKAFVGYIPPINMDAPKFFSDFPDGKMVHIVRNVWSGFSDTIKRPLPFSLERYCQLWNTVNSYARVCQRKWPNNFFTLRYEDLIEDPKSVLNELCPALGLEPFVDTPRPSFNRKPLEQVAPWGTIKYPTPEANVATAKELSHDQASQILTECKEVVKDWAYLSFYDDYLF